MGDKWIVPYGLYRAHGFVSAHLAQRTVFAAAEITHARALGKAIFPVKIADCPIHSLLTSLQVLDLTAGDGLDRLAHGLKAAGLDPTDSFDWDGSRPPYPGLLAFDESDAAIFFGRENEIREGLDNMLR